jgi:2-deoxy-D-gluconate 3-dehydrogenase
LSILDSFKLDGKTALVTGARRGIGRAMAVALA